MDVATGRRLARHIPVGPVQSRVMAELMQRFGEFVSRDRLVDIAYGDDPDGGPLDANNSMAKTVHDLRVKVARHGLMLEGRQWYGSRLRWAKGARR
jgi:DNA-binding response OmpR family regulator